MLQLLVILLAATVLEIYHVNSFTHRRSFKGWYCMKSVVPLMTSLLDSPTERLLAQAPAEYFPVIAATGLLTKKYDFSNYKIVDVIHHKKVCGALRILTDDVKYARKRIVNPKTVYSGLIDQLSFHEYGNDNDLESALIDAQAWLAFNVSLENLDRMSTIAANVASKSVLSRFVVGLQLDSKVHSASNGSEVNSIIEASISKLRAAKVRYTIFRYFNDYAELTECQTPYRIETGIDRAIPVSNERNDFNVLASGDLYRILAESIDLSKSYDQVLSVGPGSAVDREIQTIMKAQGWNERGQIAVLVGNIMDEIEEDIRLAKRRALEEEEKNRKKPPKKFRWNLEGFL